MASINQIEIEGTVYDIEDKDVTALQSLVPPQATSSNQLADKNFVNSIVSDKVTASVSNGKLIISK